MHREIEAEPVIGAALRSREIDRLIVALAERQHGIVARAQLTALGIGRRAIGHRLERGLLHRLHRGVYAVGHRVISKEGRWMAAVLAVGAGGVLSHRSAAVLWGMRSSAPSCAEVNVPRSLPSRRAIKVHHCRLAADESTEVRGIPVTTVPRTLLDLAAVVDRQQVERALHEAEVRRLTDALSLQELVARHPGHRGVVALREILAAIRTTGVAMTRSELEDLFLAVVEAAELPGPEVNARLQVADGCIEADCLWRAHRLVAELDGYATHGVRSAFERDRARDRVLLAAGWRVVRITWQQLRREPDAIASDLRRLLSDPRP